MKYTVALEMPSLHEEFTYLRAEFEQVMLLRCTAATAVSAEAAARSMPVPAKPAPALGTFTGLAACSFAGDADQE
ncbi:hypothetical protein [Nonomuraea sp. NPDC052634]|uniref:hypothetical protein n=1 Tax=Nonomuraea sp. NPDC052634 TaxID=3155813 RepID=UPI0034408CBD